MREIKTGEEAVDEEVVRVLGTAGYFWSDTRQGFVRRRRTNDIDTITLEELSDHGLTGPDAAPAQEKGLEWLDERIRQRS